MRSASRRAAPWPLPSPSLRSFGSTTRRGSEPWSILTVSGAGPNLTLTGVREGVVVLSIFEDGDLVDRFRIPVGTPTGLGLVLPASDPTVTSVFLRTGETGVGLVQAHLVLSDAAGRPVLDDAAVLSVDGAALDRSGVVSLVSLTTGERVVLEARVGDLALEDTMVATDGAVDAIARVGHANDVVRLPRGGRATCFVGMREGRPVLNAPMTVTPTAPQSVTTRVSGGLTCATPSGPGLLQITGTGPEGPVVLDVEVTP